MKLHGARYERDGAITLDLARADGAIVPCGPFTHDAALQLGAGVLDVALEAYLAQFRRAAEPPEKAAPADLRSYTQHDRREILRRVSAALKGVWPRHILEQWGVPHPPPQGWEIIVIEHGYWPREEMIG